MCRVTGTLLGMLALAASGALAACGSQPKPDDAPPVAVGPRRVPPPPARAGAAPARAVLVGEMCPSVAAGRPAIRPLFARRETWSDRGPALIAAVRRREARQFSVLGWDGRRAGLFSVVGAAETDAGVAAIGGYAGHSPCEKRRGATSERDPDCVAALRHCGVAVSILEAAGGFEARPPEEDPDPAELEVGGACLAGGNLMIDIDRDGTPEAFPASAFIDSGGGASEEVVSVAAASACTPAFAIRGAVAASGSGMDVLAVVDLDGDGRHEIVAEVRRGGKRTWILYSARSTAARLERVGMATPW
jgi:hypothetical protein